MDAPSGDCSLSVGSPAIDAGAPPADWEGNLRPIDAVIIFACMGACRVCAAPPWPDVGLTDPADLALIRQDVTSIEHTISNYVGLVGSAQPLDRAISDTQPGFTLWRGSVAHRPGRLWKTCQVSLLPEPER